MVTQSNGPNLQDNRPMLNVCVDKQRLLTRPVCFERYHYGLSLDVLVVLSARWPQREGEKKENFRIQPLLKQVTGDAVINLVLWYK